MVKKYRQGIANVKMKRDEILTKCLGVESFLIEKA